MSKPRILAAWTILLGVVWLTAGAFFYRKMMAFETEPGIAAAHPPVSWPWQSGLVLTSGKLTLVLFLHPKCSCSRASMAQISKLQDQFPRHFHTILAVWQPLLTDTSWRKLSVPGDRRLTDYQVVWDQGGRLASLFDAHTSGQAFVYDTSGRLRFAGGVTSLRGNSEEGPALASLAAVIRGEGGPTRLPVFGCSL